MGGDFALRNLLNYALCKGRWILRSKRRRGLFKKLCDYGILKLFLTPSVSLALDSSLEREPLRIPKF